MRVRISGVYVVVCVCACVSVCERARTHILRVTINNNLKQKGMEMFPGSASWDQEGIPRELLETSVLVVKF